MRSLFGSLHTAYSGLAAMQAALDVTGHNITNAETQGYTRQRVQLEPNAPWAMPGISNGGIGGQYGTGVNVAMVQRIRDQLLDRTINTEVRLQAEAETKHTWLRQIEAAFNEIDGHSLTELVGQFYDSFQELALHPENAAIRNAVLERAQNVVNAFQALDVRLRDTQVQLDGELEHQTAQINEMADKLAALNVQIVQVVNAGMQPNDLWDRRDMLVEELNKMIAVQTTVEPNGALLVTVGGKTLVRQDHAEHLSIERTYGSNKGLAVVNVAGPATLSSGDLRINGIDIIGVDPALNFPPGTALELVNQINSRSGQTGVLAELDVTGTLVLRANGEGSQVIHVETTGNAFAITGLDNGDHVVTNTKRLLTSDGVPAELRGGSLKGNRELATQSIPKLIEDLQTMLHTFVQRVNGIHETAYNLDKESGYKLFQGVRASDMQVNPVILANIRKLATALVDTAVPGDGRAALEIAQLKNQPLINDHTLEEFYNIILVDLGTQVEKARQIEENQNLLLRQLNQQRESISGVSIDEEMARMVKFQRSYQAAARMFNTVDEMLDRIVNGLGLAGR